LTDPIRAARTLIANDLARFELALAEALKPQAEYLTDAEYEIYRRGKKLRPTILLLSARLCSPAGQEDLPDKVIKASASLEMLHVATLIHDDIVDVAPTRRGLKTVYSERGTEVAVLVGDLQFIQAIRCFADGIDAQEDMALVRQVLDVGFRICCGELDEIMTDPNWEPAQLEKVYFRTVERKTAILFGLACESGATLSGGGKRASFYLSRYGRRFGSAFQIMDDIFDLMRPEELSGKAPGTDLAQGRVTLPVIYALRYLPDPETIRRILRREAFTPEELQSAVEAITASEGLMKAYSKAREMALEAADFLTEFPPSPYRDALSDIAHYIVNRGYLHPES
jgi:heptaprenyl diphosphate synthase